MGRRNPQINALLVECPFFGRELGSINNLTVLKRKCQFYCVAQNQVKKLIIKLGVRRIFRTHYYVLRKNAAATYSESNIDLCEMLSVFSSIVPIFRYLTSVKRNLNTERGHKIIGPRHYRGETREIKLTANTFRPASDLDQTGATARPNSN